MTMKTFSKFEDSGFQKNIIAYATTTEKQTSTQPTARTEGIPLVLTCYQMKKTIG